jgi:hypothetical protein
MMCIAEARSPPGKTAAKCGEASLVGDWCKSATTREFQDVPTQMSLPQDNSKRDNVVRLGTDTLCAIGEELRRMYDADLRSKPSERIERLVRLIERGKNMP